MKTTTPAKVDQTDDSSLESESSAAVVSLYNSWTSSAGADSDSESFMTDASNDPTPLPTPKELLQELRKRCRPQDIPATPVYRPRNRPVCLFINFMGCRHHRHPSTTPAPLSPPPVPVDCKSDALQQFENVDDYLAIIGNQSATLLDDHDFDLNDDDLFDFTFEMVQHHKMPRLDNDQCPLSPMSLDEDADFTDVYK